MERDLKETNPEEDQGKPQEETVESQNLETNWDESVETFDELNLKPELLRGIYGYGFEKPSAIQQKAILPIIKGLDVIAQAQSGTGKTVAFAIGSLQLVDLTKDEIQCLVLSPTRELAQQIAIVYQFLGECLKVKISLLIGGTKIGADLEKLREGPQVLVGSIGRVLDLIRRKQISLGYLQTFILDEADEMLSKGFLENIKEIISIIPTTTKILLFSATMQKEIIDMTTKFMEESA